MVEVVVATRSTHKLAEISRILSDIDGLRLLDLSAAGVPYDPAEEAIEAFDTFEENALAKALYFLAKARRPVLADDSGLCVDALGGAPGVHSKRFSGRADLAGRALDDLNNERLLQKLERVQDADRTASYTCVLALVTPGGGKQLFHGTVNGRILRAPEGEGGFGYDPLFFVPDLDTTFAAIAAEVKDSISHRAMALKAARSALLSLAASGSRSASEPRSSA